MVRSCDQANSVQAAYPSACSIDLDADSTDLPSFYSTCLNCVTCSNQPVIQASLKAQVERSQCCDLKCL